MKTRCMLCGRVMESEEFAADPYADEEDLPKKRTLQVCQICQAKLKHEADESQKIPKPM
ncbi:MAG: hypothetical protein AB1523_03215 [Bacillota bacterium]